MVITNTFWPSLSQQVCFSIACALWHCVAQQFRVVQGYGVLLFSRLRSRRSCSEDKECQQHLKNATRFFLAQKTGCGTSGCNDQIIRKPQNDIRRKCFLWWKCFLWTSCYIKRMALIYFARKGGLTIQRSYYRYLQTVVRLSRSYLLCGFRQLSLLPFKIAKPLPNESSGLFAVVWTQTAACGYRYAKL